MAHFQRLEFQRNVEKKQQTQTQYMPIKPPKKQFKLSKFNMTAIDEHEQSQNKTLIQDLSQLSTDSKLEKTHVLTMEIQKLNSQTQSQSQSIIVSKELNQSKMYELARNLKDTLQTNMEALIKEIFYLDKKYQITTFTSEQHPNYLAVQCIDSITKLNEQLEKNIQQLKLMSGNSRVIQFNPGLQITEIEQFKELQTTQFYPTQEYFLDLNHDFDQQHYSNKPVNVFQQSPNNMYLSCCQYSNDTMITIWNLKEAKMVKQIPYQSQITALIYYNDSERFIIGDETGNLALFNSSTEQITPQLQFQIHQATICQLIIKVNDQVYSCSLDNTIQLTDILKKEILLVINNDFSCFCGFDYSVKESFLIAPNKLRFLTLWNDTQGIEFSSLQMEILEQQYITICLSQNSQQVLVNFFNERKILLIQLIKNFRQLQIIKQMNLEGECYNLSWCLDDQAFIYVLQYSMKVRFLGHRTIPLILKSGLPNQFIKNKRPYFNQQNPQLQNLIIPQGRLVYLINRKKVSKSVNELK